MTVEVRDLGTLDFDWANLSTTVTKARNYLDVVEAVLEDPALPQVATRLRKLKAIQAKRPSLPPGTPRLPAGQKPPGIGLQATVKPLDAFIYYREHPWILPVGIVAALAVPGVIGYYIGKRRAR